MNTPTENAYQELQSDSTIVFETIETKQITYEYQFTKKIEKEFELWKLEVLETTDEKPTELEMLEYFKNLHVIGFSSYRSGGADVEVQKIVVNPYER